MSLTEHVLDVPLDHADPGGETISVCSACCCSTSAAPADGLRVDGERILARLIDLARGRA